MELDLRWVRPGGLIEVRSGRVDGSTLDGLQGPWLLMLAQVFEGARSPTIAQLAARLQRRKEEIESDRAVLAGLGILEVRRRARSSVVVPLVDGVTLKLGQPAATPRRSP